MQCWEIEYEHTVHHRVPSSDRLEAALGETEAGAPTIQVDVLRFITDGDTPHDETRARFEATVYGGNACDTAFKILKVDGFPITAILRRPETRI